MHSSPFKWTAESTENTGSWTFSESTTTGKLHSAVRFIVHEGAIRINGTPTHLLSSSMFFSAGGCKCSNRCGPAAAATYTSVNLALNCWESSKYLVCVKKSQVLKNIQATRTPLNWICLVIWKKFYNVSKVLVYISGRTYNIPQQLYLHE